MHFQLMKCPLIAMHAQGRRGRPMRAAIVCLAAVAVAPTLSLGAQGPSTLVPGARVRVVASGGFTPAVNIGRVLGLRGDTLLLQRDGNTDSAAIPLALLTTVESSRGLHRATMKGLGYGFAAGAIAGAIVGAASYQPCGPGFACFDVGRGGAAAIAGGAGALLGTVVGGIIGLSHQTEAWEPVAWSRPTARLAPTGIRFTPARNGGSLSVELQF